MIPLVTNQQMRSLDNKAINQYAVPGIVLMENAGRNAAEIILEKLHGENVDSVLIFCGKGNNGGDGFVIARYLHKKNIQTKLYLLAEKADIKGDAKINMDICEKSKIPIKEISAISQIEKPDKKLWIVDALLGTGVKGAVDGLYKEAIKWINHNKAYVFAIDIPSGISGDQADVAGICIEADSTITMGLPKISQYFLPARKFVGTLHTVDIGFPDDLITNEQFENVAVSEEDIKLPLVDLQLNKHTAGRIFILGGSPGMTGAVAMAAKAASLSGAGLVITGSAKSFLDILESKLTEQMNYPLPEIESGILGLNALDKVKEKCDWADTIVVGLGMGRHPETIKLILKTVKYIISLNKKLILDADALFAISQNPSVLSELSESCILTPHHGEFLRIFPDAKKDITNQPWQALKEATKKTQAVINLKGAPSMTSSAKSRIFVNTSGGPGLAKGGSGDILSGLICGFCASGLSALDASVTANYIHGKAGDSCSEKYGKRTFSMEQLLNQIQQEIKRLEK